MFLSFFCFDNKQIFSFYPNIFLDAIKRYFAKSRKKDFINF